mgnify:CR=1 FL=1
MKLKEVLSSDYFRLFIRREGKVVLGKNYSSLWLLSTVLTVTFLAIAFSNASLKYLSYKMNDPFINWVDIKNNFAENDFDGFEAALQDDAFLNEYHCRGYQTDKYWYSLFSTAGNSGRNLKCRFFADIRTPLIEAVLADDNVVGRSRIASDKLQNDSYGVIITWSALTEKLGYKEVPAYINYRGYTDPEAAEDYCAELLDDHFANDPVPVLAVVKRLPSNMDIIGTKYFYHQDNGQALNLYEPSYFSSFIYYVPDGVDSEKALERLETITREHTEMTFYSEPDMELPSMLSFRGGKFISLLFDYEDDVDFSVNREINDAFMSEYSEKGVIRLYNYIPADYNDDDDDYISVHFADLSKINDFQEYVKEHFKIEIEMSQINAKENFNAVSVMANILSWTMIAFAIVCIILFIVNLLQSYFQKVKRNLGTFKAFGISNFELTAIYVLIMVATILAATFISLAAVWLIQGLSLLLGIVRDGGFGYLSLWNLKTVISVLIIIASSVFTVWYVMKNLLKATPGDLIYDR